LSGGKVGKGSRMGFSKNFEGKAEGFLKKEPS